MARVMKVKRAMVVRLFEELGFKTAKKWDIKRLQAKVRNLPELTDGVRIRSFKVRKILKSLLAVDKVVIKTAEEGQREEKNLENVERAKKTKKVKRVVKKKVSKKKAVKKEPGKTGVLASVVEFIQESQPISREQILSKLHKRFPERPIEGMKKTISAQLPPTNLLEKKKGIKVRKDKEDNFFIKK